MQYIMDVEQSLKHADVVIIVDGVVVGSGGNGTATGTGVYGCGVFHCLPLCRVVRFVCFRLLSLSCIVFVLVGCLVCFIFCHMVAFLSLYVLFFLCSSFSTFVGHSSRHHPLCSSLVVVILHIGYLWMSFHVIDRVVGCASFVCLHTVVVFS